MHFANISTAALPLIAMAGFSKATCTSDQKIAGMKKEIATIRSHSIADAWKIPYAPTAFRVFTITPNETKPLSVFVPAGVDATSTRAVLVGLGTFLDAGVPQGSDHYTVNPNGTVTVDYIQTDRFVLEEVDVREVHSFNDACQITGIVGFVRGNLFGFTGNFNINQLIQQTEGKESFEEALAHML